MSGYHVLHIHCMHVLVSIAFRCRKDEKNTTVYPQYPEDTELGNVNKTYL